MCFNKLFFDTKYQVIKEIINKMKWCTFINKMKSYNKYSLANDFYYQYQFDNKKALNYVMDEIYNKTIINTNKLLIYLIRIWNCYDNKYAFKIGYTDNLSKRLQSINQKYNSNWRIIIIVCANINDKKIEKEIHDEISITYKKLIIGNSINNKPKELYNTKLSLYNNFVKIIEYKKLKYFESENYLYDSSCNIEKIYDEENFNGIKDEDNYIYLDQNINENKYWLLKQKFLFL